MRVGWERSDEFGERFRSLMSRLVLVHGGRAKVARAMSARLGGSYRNYEQRIIRMEGEREPAVVPPKPKLVLWLSPLVENADAVADWLVDGGEQPDIRVVTFVAEPDRARRYFMAVREKMLTPDEAAFLLMNGPDGGTSITGTSSSAYVAA